MKNHKKYCLSYHSKTRLAKWGCVCINEKLHRIATDETVRAFRFFYSHVLFSIGAVKGLRRRSTAKQRCWDRGRRPPPARIRFRRRADCALGWNKESWSRLCRPCSSAGAESRSSALAKHNQTQAHAHTSFLHDDKHAENAFARKATITKWKNTD